MQRLHNQDGFTLLELVVVLAILSGTVAIVMSITRPSSAIVEPKRTALEIAAVLRNARTYALERNAEASVTFDVDKRIFWRNASARIFPMPEDILLSITSAKSSDPSDAIATVRFFPDGTSSGGRIVLKAGNKELPIDIDWLTGAARIGHVQEYQLHE